jgi:hypothetical protein
LALAWQPDERVLLFVESLRANDSSNLRNAGFRLWANPDVLGLDVVTTRSANGGLTFGVGFGWYGIRLPERHDNRPNVCACLEGEKPCPLKNNAPCSP